MCHATIIAGNWNIKNAVELRWSAGDQWVATVQLPAGGVYEYKWVENTQWLAPAMQQAQQMHWQCRRQSWLTRACARFLCLRGALHSLYCTAARRHNPPSIMARLAGTSFPPRDGPTLALTNARQSDSSWACTDQPLLQMLKWQASPSSPACLSCALPPKLVLLPRRYVLIDYETKQALEWQMGSNAVLAVVVSESEVSVFDNW